LLATLEQPLKLALHLLYALAQIRQRVVTRLDQLPLTRFTRGQRRRARAVRLLRLAQRFQLSRELGGERRQGRVVGRYQGQGEVTTLVLQRLVLLRLLRLTLERAELPTYLIHHVADADQILTGLLELALRLVALLFVARDARRLLDEDAALVRLGREDVIELVLVHDRIGARIRAGAREEIEDVAQARRGAVQQVFTLPGAVELPTDGDLTPRDRDRAVVAELQRDFGQADRLARRRAVEDQILHALTAQRLRALLAERPANGLADVRLPTAVRADDRRDPGQHFHDRFLGERLEAVDRNRL